MKRTMLIVSGAFAGLLLLSPAARCGNDAPPFSTPEERTFILKTAGYDGQIDREEWEANRTDRGHFKGLTWEELSNFDLDGDGLVGVNEFYKYVERRLNQGREPARRTARPEGSIPAPALAAAESGVNPEGPDPRLLYLRALRARRTKLHPNVDPDALRRVEAQREEQLRLITERRRQAARNRERTARLDPDRIRDIYRTRLVKHRLARTAGGTTAHRDSLMDRLRRGGGSRTTGPERRRRQYEESRHRIAPAVNIRGRYEELRRALRPSRVSSTHNARAPRDASDIRGIIPERKKPERQANPKVRNMSGNKTGGVRSNGGPAKAGPKPAKGGG